MDVSIDHQKLEQLLKKAFFYYDLPGLSARVSTGSDSWAGVLGWQNALEKTPLQSGHIFHMASVTKTFVGTCLMNLHARGLLALDQKLSAFLPKFRMADPRAEKITIRHLLSHTSGIPDVTDYHWNRPETDAQALSRYVYSDEVQQASLLWDPSEERFSYSNIGYEILGLVIAEITGVSFEEHVAAAIFSPLAMNDSTLLTFERNMKNVAAPHGKDTDNHFVILPYFPYNRAHAPSSTLTAPLHDLEKFSRAVLDGSILSPVLQEQAFTPQALIPNNGEQICLSWFRREQNGFVLFGHEGTDDGFRSSFWICPALSLSIIVCSNLTGAPVKKITKQIFDALTIA